MSINTGWRTTENKQNVEAVVDRHGIQIMTLSPRHTEAFGALRTAQFVPTTGWTFAYNINPGLILTDTDGVTGSVTHDANFAVLDTGAAADGYAQIQTKRGSRYIPGVGGLARFTAVFDTPQDDSEQIIGQIDSVDGWAFGYNGTEFGILRRSLGVDNWIPQMEWNIDTRPGLDPQKGNVFQIAYRWLGFGAQFFYIEDDKGEIMPVHRIDYAGLNTATSIDNPNLPLTARVENKGNTTPIELHTPSAIAGLDGDPENDAIALTLATDTVKTIDSGTDVPVITIRNPETWLGKNNNMFVQALRIAFATEGAKPVLFRAIADATVTGGTYNDILTNVTPTQVNSTFTSITGGVQIGTFPLGKAGQAIVDLTGSKFKGYPGQEITIVADATTSSDVICGITFRQYL